MEFVTYSNELASAALSRARNNQPLTVAQYNAMIALIASMRDFLHDAEQLQRNGQADYPVVRAPSIPGEVVLAPLVGFSRSLPIAPDAQPAMRFSRGEAGYAARMAQRRAEMAGALGLISRRMRESAQLLGMNQPVVRGTAPAGLVLSGFVGPVAVMGESEDAVLSLSRYPGEQLVAIDPDVASSLDRLLPGAHALSDRVAADIDRRAEPSYSDDELHGAESARWMSAQYEQLARGNELMMLGVLGTVVAGTLLVSLAIRKRPSAPVISVKPGAIQRAA